MLKKIHPEIRRYIRHVKFKKDFKHQDYRDLEDAIIANGPHNRKFIFSNQENSADENSYDSITQNFQNVNLHKDEDSHDFIFKNQTDDRNSHESDLIAYDQRSKSSNNRNHTIVQENYDGRMNYQTQGQNYGSDYFPENANNKFLNNEVYQHPHYYDNNGYYTEQKYDFANAPVQNSNDYTNEYNNVYKNNHNEGYYNDPMVAYKGNQSYYDLDSKKYTYPDNYYRNHAYGPYSND